MMIFDVDVMAQVCMRGRVQRILEPQISTLGKTRHNKRGCSTRTSLRPKFTGRPSTRTEVLTGCWVGTHDDSRLPRAQPTHAVA
eukprot:1909143-Amphidinium_carterae.1